MSEKRVLKRMRLPANRPAPVRMAMPANIEPPTSTTVAPPPPSASTTNNNNNNNINNNINSNNSVPPPPPSSSSSSSNKNKTADGHRTMLRMAMPGNGRGRPPVTRAQTDDRFGGKTMKRMRMRANKDVLKVTEDEGGPSPSSSSSSSTPTCSSCGKDIAKEADLAAGGRFVCTVCSTTLCCRCEAGHDAAHPRVKYPVASQA